MLTQFSIINEDFADELAAIKILVNQFRDVSSAPRVRVAAVNSATLLLAATFEQFVREMARAYAQAVVAAAPSFKEIPQKLAQTAWRRTLGSIAEFDVTNDSTTFAGKDALQKFNSVYAFCMGDKTQDIYEELIHNENNMRPGQINALFKISDLGDACSRAATKLPLSTLLNEPDSGKAHGLLVAGLNEFFDRRNDIAHALNPSHSSGADQMLKDLQLFEAFGGSLCETLEDSIGNKWRLDQIVDRVIIKNADGSINEVASVPIGVTAVDYARAHKKRSHQGLLYTIVLKDGKSFDWKTRETNGSGAADQH